MEHVSIRAPDQVWELFDFPKRFKDDELFPNSNLEFSIDGKILGDIGEAIVIEAFDLISKQEKGIDAETSDGRTVQIKTTARDRKNAGYLFRPNDNGAELLICVHLDVKSKKVWLIYNGDEKRVRDHIDKTRKSYRDGRQGDISLATIERLKLNEDVDPNDRVHRRRVFG